MGVQGSGPQLSTTAYNCRHFATKVPFTFARLVVFPRSLTPHRSKNVTRRDPCPSSLDPPSGRDPSRPSALLWEGARGKGSLLERGSPARLVAFSNCGRFGRGNTMSRVPPTSRDPLPLLKRPHRRTIVDECAQMAESGLKPPFESPHVDIFLTVARAVLEVHSRYNIALVNGLMLFRRYQTPSHLLSRPQNLQKDTGGRVQEKRSVLSPSELHSFVVLPS